MNWRDWTANMMPPWLKANWGERFVGVHALLADTLSEALAEAMKVRWVREETFPPDALVHLGFNRNLERYPAETDAQYKARLDDAWNSWPLAGDETSIVDQLAAAGYPGCTVICYTNIGGPHGEPPPYWTQFWVRFPVGSHPVVAAGPEWGTAVWGSFSWGTATIPAAFAATVRGIINKFKPADWVCRGCKFQIAEALWGSVNWAEFVWGGQASMENDHGRYNSRIRYLG